MAFDVHKEDVFPRLMGGWAGLYFAEVDFAFGENLKNFAQRADTMWNGKDQACLVVFGRSRLLPAENEKPGGISLRVTDVGSQYLQPVNFRREGTDNRRRPLFPAGPAGSLSGAGGFFRRNMGMMGCEPLAALSQRLVMGTDAQNLFRLRADGKGMLNLQVTLPADRQIGMHEGVVRSADPSFGRVLNRDNACIRIPPGNDGEYLWNTATGDVLIPIAKPGDRRLMGIGAHRAEAGNAERFLKAAAGGKNLVIDGTQALGAKRPLVFILDALEQVFLPSGVEDRNPRRFFNGTHLQRKGCPLVQEMNQFRIEAVNFAAEFLETHELIRVVRKDQLE